MGGLGIFFLSINTKKILVYPNSGEKYNCENKTWLGKNKFNDQSISNWIKEIQQKNGLGRDKFKVILNGADRKVFFKKTVYKDPKDVLSIVTHHWSDNKNKGYEIYKYLDKLMGQKNFRKDFTFSYIGNLDPSDFPNTHYLGPMNRNELAEKLRQFDIYITAADFEAAGMHHIEAACSGLPILFLENSSIKDIDLPILLRLIVQVERLPKLLYKVRLKACLSLTYVNYKKKPLISISRLIQILEQLYKQSVPFDILLSLT